MYELEIVYLCTFALLYISYYSTIEVFTHYQHPLTHLFTLQVEPKERLEAAIMIHMTS